MNHDRKEITRVLTVPLACACLLGALLWPNWREEIYAQTYYCYDSSSSAAPASGSAALTASAAAVSTLDEPVDCEESPYLCVDSTSRYIARVHADLLGRWPGPTEIAAARAAYPQGLPDLQFAQEIVASQEYRHQVVQNLTQRLLGRPATNAEQDYWAPQGHRAITLGLLTSPEYETRTGGTAPAFVAGVYKDLLARNADTAELREALARIATHGRTAVVQSLYDSEEHHEEQVESVYRVMLRQPTTPIGRAEGVRLLHAGGPLGEIIASIIATEPYVSTAGDTRGAPVAAAQRTPPCATCPTMPSPWAGWLCTNPDTPCILQSNPTIIGQCKQEWEDQGLGYHVCKCR